MNNDSLVRYEAYLRGQFSKLDCGDIRRDAGISNECSLKSKRREKMEVCAELPAIVWLSIRDDAKETVASRQAGSSVEDRSEREKRRSQAVE